MRVISGECKGRPLKAVPGSGTRPTTDKVKEAIFNIIGPYFESGTGLDLFAGSGGLGIEAMSRGLEKVIFVDKDYKAIQTIKSNLEYCGYGDNSEVYRNDAGRAIKAVIKRGLTFHYVFLDPPYKKQKLQELLEEIEENDLLIESGYAVCEHSSDIVLPKEIGCLHSVRTESYGIIGITIYQKIKQL
ncbi:16S rRNA (guanine(966)-N(2))-methyltransferase RsmD [Bacillus salacetis]|uniref:16S rRNA (Guanine(966)-N(2))-methyltransferase RsmD n=1 Tax=Bacillus salacetis TaxID=2315464 RepID=A0A3A1R2N0_9BACI|nr:16S rRNA (guanine(966)-N(2))-methyltransferase RsmD [Bacillus salacetis]RIW36297.1 16S rRNA (guanine(966)-N(2))-methyltransferase RsmD [Bacillus salacetis]